MAQQRLAVMAGITLLRSGQVVEFLDRRHILEIS